MSTGFTFLALLAATPTVSAMWKTQGNSVGGKPMVGKYMLDHSWKGQKAMAEDPDNMSSLMSLRSKSSNDTDIEVFVITMADKYNDVKKFFKRYHLEEHGAISAGVNRSLLDWGTLLESGKVVEDYTLSGTKQHQGVAELATTMAHEHAALRFLESGAKYGVVMEDDVELVEKIYSKLPNHKQGLLRSFKNIIDKAPKDFHEINLGRCWDECRNDKVLAHVGPALKIVDASRSFCSTAYILSRDGAQTLVDKVFRHLDRSNDWSKIYAHLDGTYKSMALSPRMFQQTRDDDSYDCGGKAVNGCLKQPECGEFGSAGYMEDIKSSDYV